MCEFLSRFLHPAAQQKVLTLTATSTAVTLGKGRAFADIKMIITFILL